MDFRMFVFWVFGALLFFALGILVEGLRRRRKKRPQPTLTTEVKMRCACGQTVVFPVGGMDGDA